MFKFSFNKKKRHWQEQGLSVVLILIFGGIFTIILVGFIGLVIFRYNQSIKARASMDALHIAEAGINYYRWHLIKNPNDIQDGQGWCCQSPPCDTCGPYVHDYYDPEGKKVGQFSLEISAKKMCGEVLGVYIRSTGQTDLKPEIKRTVQVKMAATSIAEYSYLLNDSVWAGSDRKIAGLYHSNGGIRMDGTHNSLVTSAVKDWLCTSSFGCYWWSCPNSCQREGAACRCPGIFGQGSDPDLWQYPVTSFDFEGLTSDLAKIKSLAQQSGAYYPLSSDLNNKGKGYHVIFNPDGTYDIRIITDLDPVFCYDLEKRWHWCDEKIAKETTYQQGVSLSEDCGLVFVEDDLWVEGTVKGKKTIASANLINPGQDTSVILNWNLDYTTLNGSDSLAVITEKDILIPVNSPDNMTLRGVFVAQKGHFGRNHYLDPNIYWWYCWWHPNRCYPSARRNHLLIYGSIVSNGRVGTKWSSGSTWVSGYSQRENYFDAKLANDPPPLLPYVSETLEFISWEEVD